jgi:hypothetical protein
LSNPAQAAALQDWIVILAIVFAIGGGLLASLLFEFLRPPHEHSAPAPPDARPLAPQEHSPSQGRAPGVVLSALAALLLIGYLRQRRNRGSLRLETAMPGWHRGPDGGCPAVAPAPGGINRPRVGMYS